MILFMSTTFLTGGINLPNFQASLSPADSYLRKPVKSAGQQANAR